MTQPPPSRYRIVERGRRLEVIDTRTGKPVPSSVPPRLGQDDRKGRPLLQRLRRAPAGVDDGNVFTTRRWYDEKGPRTVRMNFRTRAKIDRLRYGAAIAIALLVAFGALLWPVGPILLVSLASAPKLRAQLRAWTTRWVDGLDQAA